MAAVAQKEMYFPNFELIMADDEVTANIFIFLTSFKQILTFFQYRPIKVYIRLRQKQIWRPPEQEGSISQQRKQILIGPNSSEVE